ncbi:MAG: ASKHA domain-containing protein [Candidatus Bipolaricaulaceae bacterium]
MTRREGTTLRVLPQDITLRVAEGATLLSSLQQAGLPVESACGGRGRCGRCRVRFLAAPPATAAEQRLLSPQELAQGLRLACQHRLSGDCTVELPPAGRVSQAKVQSGRTRPGPCRPAAGRRQITVGRGQQTGESDLENLQAALGDQVEVSPPALAQLAAALARGRHQLSVITVGQHLVAVRPGEEDGPYGLAVDLGTSTVAAYLLDLEGGNELAALAVANPQGAWGADVLSRIAHVQDSGPAGLEQLRGAAVAAVNELAQKLAAQAGLTTDHLHHLVVVGNPTMLHLLAGVDPVRIGRSPFCPTWRRGLDLPAARLGLAANPAARATLGPAVSAYVGADSVAAAVACGLGDRAAVELLLDLGANGEILLAAAGQLWACAAAAGPAFEGGGITCGMSALEGAVSRVELDDGELSWSTVGERSPRGICGSGLVDVVGVLLSAGLMDATGRLRPGQTGLAARLHGQGKERRFVLAEGDPPVFVTQRDLRQVQLAKAALRAGIEALLAEAGLNWGDVERISLAGAFGSQLRPQSLARIGLLPAELLARTHTVGNAAGEGAKAMLLDRQLAEEAEHIAGRVRYLELSADRTFAQRFVQAMRFPAPAEEVRA